MRRWSRRQGDARCKRNHELSGLAQCKALLSGTRLSGARILSDRARPTTAANNGDDKMVNVSYWANHAPLCVEDYEVSPVGLNKGAGISVRDT